MAQTTGNLAGALPQAQVFAESRVSERRKFWRRVVRLKGGMAGGIVTLVLVLIALFGPLLTPHDPITGRITDRLKPPVWLGGTHNFLLGTDQIGRDELSRLILGTRVSLEAGADDVESDDEGHWIYCPVEALGEVSDALEKALGESTESKLIWKPQSRTEVDLETAQKLMRLIDMLEEDDDVQTVTHNFDIPEDVAAQLDA